MLEEFVYKYKKIYITKNTKRKKNLFVFCQSLMRVGFQCNGNSTYIEIKIYQDTSQFNKIRFCFHLSQKRKKITEKYCIPQHFDHSPSIFNTQ